MSFTVITLTNVPPSLKGHLNCWFTELSCGTFVGDVPAGVRELLWSKIIRLKSVGGASCAYPDRSEMGYTLLDHGNREWTTSNFDGLTLVRRNIDNDGSRRGRRTAENFTEGLDFLLDLEN